jgi:hypothetical protein
MDWYEAMGLKEPKQITVYYQDDSEPDCKREESFIILDGKRVYLTSASINLEKDTLKALMKIFECTLEIKWVKWHYSMNS